MFKIALAHQKGGVGKSMLTKAMSLELDRAVVADLDPQGSVAYWIEAREKRDLMNPAAAICDVEELPRLIKKAEERGYKHLLIDTPPDHDNERSIRAALALCDVVIIPTKLGFEDLRVVPKTAAIAQEMGKPWSIVLNMGIRSNLLEDTKEKLQALADSRGGYFCPKVLMNRVIHAECAGFNMVPSELEPDGLAAKEITAMTADVVAALKAELAQKEQEAAQ